jgi:hypothetical protein
MAQIASIQSVPPSLGGDAHDGAAPPLLQSSVGAVDNGDRQRENEAARRGEQSDVSGSWGGAQSIDDNVLRHVMHGLTAPQRHLVYRRAFAMRRGAHGSGSGDDDEPSGEGGDASLIDFLALNVALRSMQGGRDSSARNQASKASIEELQARRDAIWQTSRNSISQWIPGSETSSAGRRGELSGASGNEPEYGPIASSTSALDFLRRLVLPQRGKLSDSWFRQALAEVSQAGKRFVRGDDILQQLTALRLAGFAVTVRQVYELAGRLDKRLQAAGLSNRMSQLQLSERLLECAGAPGNFKALCKMVASEQSGQPAVERDIMTMIYSEMQALPPQAWPESGSRPKFQEGIVSQLRDIQAKPWLSYRRPVPVATGQTPSRVDTHDTDQGLLLWS